MCARGREQCRGCATRAETRETSTSKPSKPCTLDLVRTALRPRPPSPPSPADLQALHPKPSPNTLRVTPKTRTPACGGAGQVRTENAMLREGRVSCAVKGCYVLWRHEQGSRTLHACARTHTVDTVYRTQKKRYLLESTRACLILARGPKGKG